MEQNEMEKGAESPEWERHAAAESRVEALEAAHRKVDAYCGQMERRLQEAGAVEERVVEGADAAVYNKMSARSLAKLFFEFVSMVGKTAKSLSEGLKELVLMKQILLDSLRNVKELQRLYAELVEKVMDERNKLDEWKKLLDERDALVPECDGKRLACPKWLPDDDLLLTDEERALNRWVDNGKRTRYYAERLRRRHNLKGTVALIREMWRAEEQITAEVVMDMDFYRALLPFVPKDNVAFRERKRAWEALSGMVGQENRRLQELEKVTDPGAARHRGEALIKHAEEQEHLRSERAKAEKAKRKTKRGTKRGKQGKRGKRKAKR